MRPILLLSNRRGGRRLPAHHFPLLTRRGLRLNLAVTAPRGIRNLNRRLPRSGFDNGVGDRRLIVWRLRK